jgi:glycosyltransferase involved in cell wall biosynthesis
VSDDSSLMKVSIVALTLNEIEGVQAILPTIQPQWYDQLVVVDGGSRDGTVEWCRAHGYDVFKQRRRGIRYAYLEVLPHLTGEIILTLSPDGNCATEFIPEMIAKIREGSDLVIGSRYLGDAHSDDDDAITGFGNWLFTRTVNLLHGGHYTDAMVIYRAFRRQLIDDLDLTDEATYTLPEKLFGTIMSWEPVMAVRAARAGKRIAEVAAGEPARIGGQRKLQMFRWGGAYYFQFWHELWHWPTKRRGAPTISYTDANSKNSR